MQILSTAARINAELVRSIKECSSCQVAVAWASVGFDAFDMLVAHSSKIERMVVGTHFYQTHPLFMEAFLTNPSARFVMNTAGVFHPKVYLFDTVGGDCECIIGSANFTRNGLTINDEIVVHLTDNDDGAQQAFADVRSSIERYWHAAGPISQGEFRAYREAWKRKREVLTNLHGKFGSPHEENADDRGKAPLKIPALLKSWSNYFNDVKSEKLTPYGHSMGGRLKVIEFAQRLFSKHAHFRDMNQIDRQRIAGLVPATAGDPIDYRWFGSMKGAGKFWHAINANDENLSLALDVIPLTGAVSRETYLDYIDRYRRAFPDGRDGVGTASRLLAMKRPDTFVCLDKRNREGLCGDFGISRAVDYEEYYDSIIARIMEASWWRSAPPQDEVEKSVWAARAAFLDSIYYDGSELTEP